MTFVEIYTATVAYYCIKSLDQTFQTHSSTGTKSNIIKSSTVKGQELHVPQ